MTDEKQNKTKTLLTAIFTDAGAWRILLFIAAGLATFTGFWAAANFAPRETTEVRIRASENNVAAIKIEMPYHERRIAALEECQREILRELRAVQSQQAVQQALTQKTFDEIKDVKSRIDRKINHD